MTNRFAALKPSSPRQSAPQPAPAARRQAVQFDPDDIPLSPEYLAELESRADVPVHDAVPFWSSYALPMFDQGWMVVPQQRTGLSRITGIVDGKALKWGAYTKHRPPREEIEYWVEAHDSRSRFVDNVAILLGEPSGNSFCLDVDVTDPDMNRRVQRLIAEEVGDTFARVGNAPKIALIYRVERPDDIPAYGRFLIADDAGNPTGDAIEILGNGRLITAIGRHHSTHNSFEWNIIPTHNGPQRATLVTPEQLGRLYDRFAAELPLHKPARARQNVVDFDFDGVDLGELRVPHVAAWGSHQWVEVDGLVADGREAFIYSVTRQIVRHNPRAPAETLIAAVIERFRQSEHPDKRWSDAKVGAQAFEKVHRAIAAVKDGRIAIAKRRGIKTETVTETQLADLVDPIAKTNGKPRSEASATSFLPKRRSAIPVKFSAPDPAKAAERALQPDRAGIGGAASDRVVAGIDAFLDDVAAQTGRIHVIKGPTGIGKSTQAIKRLGARHDQIFAPMQSPDGTGLGPMLFIVPTYSNVADLRERADMLGLPADATDDDLRTAAAERGLVAEGDVDEYMTQLRRFAMGSRLSHMTYEGKVRAGCQRIEEMRLLQAAHVPTSGMCSAKVAVRDSNGRHIGETEEVRCQFYTSCKAILQRAALAEHDLVFLVRNFVTLSVPEEIAHPRGVVIDERCFDLLVHTTTMPMSTLSKERREPRLRKKEKEAGIVALDLLQDRHEAAAVALEALRLGHDVGETLARHVVETKTGRRTGIEYVAAARRVCGNAMTSQADLTPTLTLRDVQELCARPAGTGVGEEYRFWSLIEDRVKHLLECQLSGRKPLPDRRVRLLDPASADPEIQLNWRSDPNWSSAPLLLLDASTDEVLTGLAFGGHRPVVVHDVPVSMNQRVILAVDKRLSMKSLFPGDKAKPEDHRTAANLLAEIRNSISYLAGAHAHGRVLFVMPMKLRRAVLFNWRPPFNADFLHYGAVAGLDFARRHVAVVMISRMELPVQEVDGIVSALSYGMADLEPLIDPRGTGQDEDGDELYPHVERHVHPMRDGGTAEWDRQVHAGDLARRVQRQYREFELNQAAGRGRAVHREDPVTIVAVTESVPDDMIADEVVGFGDLTGFRARFWDAVRLTGGIVDPELMARYAPHLGETVDFEKGLAAFFLDEELVRSRYHRITATFADGTRRDLYVAGHIAGWTDHLVGALKACGMTGKLSNAVPCACVIEAADEAPIDKIQQVITAMDTAAVEHAEINRLTELAMARGEWRHALIMGATVPSSYRVGEGVHERCTLPIGGWLALAAIGDEWVRTGRMDATRAESLGLLDVVDVAA